MYKNSATILLGAALIYLMTACSPAKNITYLQDIQPGVSMMVQNAKKIKLEPGDQLRVIIHSRDGEIMKIFNLTNGSNERGINHASYTVDDRGYIDMPVLGQIKVLGLTREEAANEIKYRLLASRMVKDPIVTIEYGEMGYSVLGEVRSPGRKSINRDKITLLEGIASAGDLTIEGRRDNILVLREENGMQTPYRVNLLETESLYSSPVYYLQQNDVIYVEPNEKKVNQSTVNGSTFLTPGFWMSTASFVISLVLLLTK